MDKIIKIFGYAKIGDIKIQEEFKKHPPRISKMIAREVYYLRYGKFQQPIVLNKKRISNRRIYNIFNCESNGQKMCKSKKNKGGHIKCQTKKYLII